MLNAFRVVLLAFVLLTPTFALAATHDRDWFIRQIQPNFITLFETCDCPVYGFEDIMTWEDKTDTTITYWSVTVVLSEKRSENYWQMIGRTFTYQQIGDERIRLVSISETFVWNPT